MKKTLFTAALALALSLGGAALSAQETSTDAITLEKDHSLVTLVVESKLDVNLKHSNTDNRAAAFFEEYLRGKAEE